MAELKPIQLYKTITACRLCSSTDLRRTIPLVSLPVTSPNVGRNRMVAETAPSDVYQCENCGFLQLSTVVDPEFQYRGFKYREILQAVLPTRLNRLGLYSASGAFHRQRC